MNEVKLFESEEFGLVRTVIIDDEPWFVGKDIALALGYVDTDQALRNHVDEDDKLTRQIKGSGQARKMNVINESGLYALIFGSQLPTAKKFKKWVTSEVLPSIRKNGGYIAGQGTLSDDELLEKALLVAQRKIADRDRTIAEQVEQITEMQPKAEYFDEICNAKTLTNFRDAGKLLGMSQTQFTGYLTDNGYIYMTSERELRPTEPYRKSDLFQMKHRTSRRGGQEYRHTSHQRDCNISECCLKQKVFSQTHCRNTAAETQRNDKVQKTEEFVYGYIRILQSINKNAGREEQYGHAEECRKGILRRKRSGA